MKRRPTNYIKKSFEFLRNQIFSFSLVGLKFRCKTDLKISYRVEKPKNSGGRRSNKAPKGRLNLFSTFLYLMIISLILFWLLGKFQAWVLATPFVIQIGASLSEGQILLIADKALDILLKPFSQK